MTRRLTLISALALGVVLLVMQHSSPLFVDFIVRAVDLIAKVPFSLVLVVALLGLTMGAGAWATMTGIRAHGKRVRIGRRRRLRIYH